MLMYDCLFRRTFFKCLIEAIKPHKIFYVDSLIDTQKRYYLNSKIIKKSNPRRGKGYKIFSLRNDREKHSVQCTYEVRL